MKTKRKTTPAASALVASRNFLMTPPPLLAVMQGGDYLLHSNLFTASITAQYVEASRSRAVIGRPYSSVLFLKVSVVVRSDSRRGEGFLDTRFTRGPQSAH